MLAVVSARYGVALACIVAVPGTTPVTATAAVVALAANVTVAGTVAIDVLLELKLTVSPPAGAGPERVSVRFCETAPLIVIEAGENAMDPVVVTCCVDEV